MCGIWDWDQDLNLKNAGPGTGTGTDKKFRDQYFKQSWLCPEIILTRDSGTQLWGTVPETKEFRDSVKGTENFPGHDSGPVPTPA